MTNSGAPKSVAKPETMAGFKKFSHTMLEVTKKYIMPKPEEMKALGEVFQNHLFDLDGPKQVRSGPSTPKKVYFSKMFYGFTEIFDSLEMLDDIFFLAGRFPYANSRISRERYLQFLVEAHSVKCTFCKSAYINPIQRTAKFRRYAGV
jgi:hypothetical protein